MNMKRHLLETLTLVVVSALCALVANQLAARERRLALRGSYPNALKVPSAAAEPLTPVTGSPETSPDAGSPPVTSAAAPEPAPSTAPAPPAKAAAQTAPAAAARPAPAPAKASPADLLSRFPPHKDKPYVEIHGDDVAWLHARGALFLDARRTNVYEEGHIAGARSMPVWESDINDRVMALLNEGRDTSQPVVLYCSGGDCEDSHLLAEKLFGAGFENLLVYRDGWPDWVKRGGAAARGGQP